MMRPWWPPMARAAFIRCIFAVVVALAASGHGSAQATDDPTTAAQYPAPINTFEVAGGYRFSFDLGTSNQGFYRLSYKGSLVDGLGTPFKYAAGLDLAEPALPTGTGDRHQVTLRFERGTTTIGGGLFEAIGVQPLLISGLEAAELRGTALLAADADAKTFQFAVGLETKPYRIPGLQNTPLSNWLVFGLNAHRQEDTNSGNNDATVGLLTYRAFLGYAFGWRKSADVGKTAARIEAEILRQAPTFEAAEALADKIAEIPVTQTTHLQKFFQTIVVEAQDHPEDWRQYVVKMAYGQADAITDQPTFALYAENSGWYSFVGSLGGSGLKNLLTVTLDYWPWANNDLVFLRLRYERGFELALPTTFKDHLLMAVNVRF